jgi:hypothetical protein
MAAVEGSSRTGGSGTGKTMDVDALLRDLRIVEEEFNDPIIDEDVDDPQV